MIRNQSVEETQKQFEIYDGKIFAARSNSN